MSDPVLVAALVKLRHRIDGLAVTLTQSEAQALYVAVLREATPDALTGQEHAEQVAPREMATDSPYGVAVRQALGWQS